MSIKLHRFNFTIAVALALTALLWPAASSGQTQKQAPGSAGQTKKQTPDPGVTQKRMMEMHEKGMKPPTGQSFFIDPVGENQARFSVLFNDVDNRTVADTFMRSQIEIFEALMVEAKKFAETNEAVGTKAAPKTTRFVDKNEKAFIIDVTKAGEESHFYLTMRCMNGVITLDAGVIPRNKKTYAPPLFESILTRVHDSLQTAPQVQ